MDKITSVSDSIYLTILMFVLLISIAFSFIFNLYVALYDVYAKHSMSYKTFFLVDLIVFAIMGISIIGIGVCFC